MRLVSEGPGVHQQPLVDHQADHPGFIFVSLRHITHAKTGPVGCHNVKPVHLPYRAVIVAGEAVVRKHKALVAVGYVLAEVFLIDIDDHGADPADLADFGLPLDQACFQAVFTGYLCRHGAAGSRADYYHIIYFFHVITTCKEFYASATS